MLKWASIGKKRQTAPADRRGPAADRFEVDLLASVVQGRRAEFDALYRLYHPRLTRFLAHLVRQPAEIEAVLNDTMLVVWQRAAEFNGRGKLSTWIFGIAYRKAIKAVTTQDLPADGDAADAQAGADTGPQPLRGAEPVRERLRRALDGLSLEHRTVVELCFFHDMAYAEIAEVVGCPCETVKTRMFYARRRLRLLLDELDAQQQGAGS
jgi:RNA polymerase sigma-70 factor (ECF subfamily)